VRNDGAVTCFRPRIMSPSNRPDFYVVISHRKASLVEYPAFEPFDLAQPIALFRLWRERRVGGTRYGNHTRNGLRYMLLEVSALGARDRLSTSHYRGRSP